MDLQLLLLWASLALLLGSGLLALPLFRSEKAGGLVSATGAVAGAVVGLVPVIHVLGGGAPVRYAGAWPMPNGALLMELDPLSAFFLAPVLVVGALAALYGRTYLAARTGRGAHLPHFGFNFLLASMAMVVLARNGVLFLVAWEAMAVSAFFLVAYAHHDPEARKAGWVYLVATHLGTAALLAMFLVLARHAGSYDFAAFAASPPRGLTGGAIAVLAFIGFGAKAGFVPLHVWLPQAHAAAPSHVSAIMSGVVIKLGLYGLLRAFTWLGEPAPWWGPALVALGAIGGMLAIGQALLQQDLKRALAYSSVENVGVICLGLGIGYGAGRHAPEVAALAMSGALLHVWNHSLMKGTMFLAAGSVVHATGTRDMDRLGGLARSMPLTSIALTIGAVALSALPPLNGFASELLIYLGLVRDGLGSSGPYGVLALCLVGLLAFIGALAALSFVRLWGITLLGQPRTPAAAQAHESPPGMTGPMMVLMLGCVAIGALPGPAVAALRTVVAQLSGAEAGATLTPVVVSSQLGSLHLALWSTLLVLAATLWLLRRRHPEGRTETWGCGYAAPTPRMQYRALAFSELLIATVLPRALRPRLTRDAVQGPFPAPAHLTADYADPLMRGVYEPIFQRFAGRLSAFAWLQQGVLQTYLLYVFVAVLIGLGWATWRAWGWP